MHSTVGALMLVLINEFSFLGNHDVTFDDNYYAKNWERYHKSPYDIKQIQACLKGLDWLTFLEVRFSTNQVWYIRIEISLKGSNF